mmetsp:Transcript_6720/g.10331  ORF Transcript_6720/g.10331 Transcript_6720/m.10331 type:complete len:311 (+) Transcript_6720:101-1033(+)
MFACTSVAVCSTGALRTVHSTTSKTRANSSQFSHLSVRLKGREVAIARWSVAASASSRSTSAGSSAPALALSSPSASVPTSRRELLSIGAFLAAVGAAAPTPAWAAYGSAAGESESAAGSAAAAAAEDLAFTTFYGAANPPATYGYLGGTTAAAAKYSYDVPPGWKEEAPTKVEKGAGGQDSRWVLGGSRGTVRCYCLTLNRAGEDGAAFDLTEKALTAIAGADPRMQEAITTGVVTSTKSTVAGQDYELFEVKQSTIPVDYSLKITVDNTGRLFAFVVAAPERVFNQDRKTFDKMLDSFKTYKSSSQFV